MSDGTNLPRPRIRVALSLRFLFGIITAAAVACWLAWDFYPRYKIQPKIEALAAKDDDDRQLAEIEVRKLGDQAVQFLLRGLRHDHRQVRWESAFLLGEMAKPGVAVPALVSALGDADPDVCTWAAGSLGRIGESAASAAPALVKSLQHRERNTRMATARALGRIGPKAAEAVPALTAALQDKSLVAVQAALALWRITGSTDVSVPTLVDILERGDKTKLATSEAAIALGAVGPAAKQAIPVLRELIDDERNSYTRKYAIEALQEIDPPTTPK